ncbi:MAG TPA: SprT family zinc-dependent metalloprotease [Kiritimatiellia bacterium]|nr:SprT family zinc-dependent metalloprotease [Kiritimatiellia bacterium]
MNQTLKLGELDIEVIQKDIRNIHLSVYPPAGRVRVSAPKHMSPSAIRVFTLSKLDWIKKQQRKIRAQDRETRRLYVNRESHYVWGRRYLLQVIEHHHAPAVRIKGSFLELLIRPDTDEGQRRDIVEAWYRDLVRAELPALLSKWEPVMGVTVSKYHVRRMKTLWGSCTPGKRSIRINTDLAKKPIECLEYIVVHEMAHLLEASHNARFIHLMDTFMPTWRLRRKQLNQLPLRHEDWRY